jgi:ABC-type transport system substrate-binding protein
MKKSIALLLALVMIFGLLAGCAPKAVETEVAAPAEEEAAPAEEEAAPAEEEAAAAGSKVIVAVPGDPSNLGPFVGMSLGRIGVLTTMYEYLFYLEGPHANPYIAESVEKVADKTYEVTIFDYVTDSAGNHITAEDVAYSYNTAMEMGELKPLGDIESVTAKSDYVVEFVTKAEPGPGALEKMLVECPIVSKAAYEASDDQFATKPITTSAYVLTEYVPGSSLTFERRADYWQTDRSLSPVVTQANVQTAVFQIISEPAQHTIALQTGSASISTSVPGSDVPLFDDIEGFTVNRNQDNLTNLLMFNGSEGNPFASKELRQAVSYAIDTQALCDAIAPGACNPAHEIGNNNFIGYLAKWDDESYYDYDLDKAKELLAAAGYEPGDLEVTLLAQSQPPSTGLVCQVIQADLAELGITVNISQVDPPVFNSEKTDPTKFDMTLDASAGGDYVFSPWQLMFDQNRYNGTTSNWFKDDQLQAVMDTAAAESTFNDENVDAAWMYIKEQNYGYGLFSYVNNIVNVSGITSVFLDSRGFVVPGACEYAPDF